MFKKLLANLPFNPGLISQVSSYRLRLKSEVRLRFLGFILLVLALSIQLVAVNYAPQRLAKEVPASCIYASGTDCSQLAGSSDSQLVTIALTSIVVIAGYLYIRSRLMSRELEGIRQQYNREGGF